MKERKQGDKFITKKGKLLEIVAWKHSTNCCLCYYYKKPKCIIALCNKRVRKDNTQIYYKDITNTLSKSDQILIERGLLKNFEI